ncbi:MAG TPA: galactokinase [Dehalococcoidia bacterium]|nr:galactokinase [Dehalococcoidia bacterium]
MEQESWGQLLSAFRRRFGRWPTVLAHAPGRANIIGEHTDYNGGHVLPAAIDRRVAVAAAPSLGSRCTALALDLGEEDSFAPHDGLAPGWRGYVRGALFLLRRHGVDVPPLLLAISGSVPIASGLSSSAALTVSLLAAMCRLAGTGLGHRRVAALAQQVENEAVGVACGPMDPLVAVMGRRDHALLIDCLDLSLRPVPLRLEERGLYLAVVDSGVRRPLAETAYNQRRRECEEAARLLERPCLRRVTWQDLERATQRLDEPLQRRVRHFLSEEERTLRAAALLEEGRPEELGPLLSASHASLRDDFQVSSPELDLLVELAAAVPGVLGVRLTGAGFGGCVLVLARREALAGLEGRVLAPYRERTGLVPRLLICRADDGLRVEEAP